MAATGLVQVIWSSTPIGPVQEAAQFTATPTTCVASRWPLMASQFLRFQMPARLTTRAVRAPQRLERLSSSKITLALLQPYKYLNPSMLDKEPTSSFSNFPTGYFQTARATSLE